MDSLNFIVNQSPLLLQRLKIDTPSSWGGITAQQMVEHLSLEIAYASKKIIPKRIVPAERMAFWKAKFFNNNTAIPKNFTAKGTLPAGQVMPSRFSNLQEAIKVYKDTIEEFIQYFEKDIARVTFHPFFGYLSYDEWIYYLSRHIKHHFYQFGLLDSKGNPTSEVVVS